MATAAVVDAATSSAVRTQSNALDSFTGEYAAQHGATITVTSYHAERVQEPSSKLDLKQLELRGVTREVPATSASR